MFIRGLVCLLLGLHCYADEAANIQPQIRDLGDGIFQVGGVKLDKNARTVTFPAKINMNEGVIEYLLVNKTGKTHESLLTTDVEPFHVQVAMLLLGAKGSPESRGELPPGGPLSAAALAHAPKLEGDNVLLFVQWNIGGIDKRVSAEDLVRNEKAGRNATRGVWTYNGSGFYGPGRFAAQVEGSMVAMVTDPIALVNNPRPGNHDDSIWLADPARTPPKDTPVQFVIQLVQKEKIK